MTHPSYLNQGAPRERRAPAAPPVSMPTSATRPHRARTLGLSIVVLLVIQAFSATPLVAQSTDHAWAAGRQDLDARAAAAERDAADGRLPSSVRGQRANDASAIRARLRDGDFRAGDRLVLSVRNEPTLSDTFTVRDGPVLKLPDIPDIAMKGVLRSEVETVVAAGIGKYLRDREVHVMPLVNIGVLGQVARPGYYQLPVDALLSDALMAAGGPTPVANPDHIVVRRAGMTLFAPKDVRENVATSKTLGELEMRSGDDIMIDERQRRDWTTIAQVGGVVTSVIFSAIWVARR